MITSRTDRYVFVALLAFLALPVSAQSPDAPSSPSQNPGGRDASFLPPDASPNNTPSGEPIPLVTPPSPLPPNPPANAPASPAPVVSLPAPAPVAGPPDIKQKLVESDTLQNIDPGAIGTLAPEDGGLGAAMWKGTPRELVDRILPAVTLPTGSAALNALAQRFLLTIAGVPQGGSAGSQSLTAMRVEKLVALGDAADAWNLAFLAKPDQVDEATLRLAGEAALVSSAGKDVCAKLPGIIQGHSSTDWQKLLIVCQLQGGDSKSAQLGLEVLHAQNAKDDVFFELAEHNIIGGAKSLPRQLTPLKPLNLALLRLIDQSLPPEIYSHPEADVIAGLLQTKTREDSLRLALAERAAARGLIDGTQLAAAYASAAFTADQLANAINDTEKGPPLRALLYQAAQTEKTPQKRFDMVSKFLDSLDTAPLNGATARVLAGTVGDVAATGEYAAFAPAATHIYIMADRPKDALGWLKLAREGAERVPEMAVRLHQLWPLVVLSGLETDAAYGQIFGVWIKDALRDADPAKREQTGAMLLVFDAAGFAVPEDAWAHIADLPAVEKRLISPPALLLERLRAAGMANRRGEAVLLALAIAGANGNELALMPEIDTIRALRLCGLNADALALARETASALLAPQTAAAKP